MVRLPKVLRWVAALFLVSCMLLAPMEAVAQTNPLEDACQGAAGSPVCNTTGEDPIAGEDGAVVQITTILAIIAGIVSVIFVVIGGLKYVTSGGDSSATSSAKSTIVAALIGLIIAALARPIVSFVIGRL